MAAGNLAALLRPRPHRRDPNDLDRAPPGPQHPLHRRRFGGCVVGHSITAVVLTDDYCPGPERPSGRSEQERE